MATGKTLSETAVGRQYTQSNNGILAGNNFPLDTIQTENNLETKREAEERILHSLALVHNVL